MNFISRYLKRTYFVVSKNLLSGSNKQREISNYYRYTILYLYVLLVFFVITIFTIQNFFSNDKEHIFLIDIPTFFFIPIFLIYLQRKINIVVASHIFMFFLSLILLLVFNTGGAYLTGPVFYLMFPPIAFFIMGLGFGIIYSVAVLILIALDYIVFHHYNWFPDYNIHQFYRYFIVALIVMSASFLYERVVQQYNISIEKLISRLESKNKKLKEKESELLTINEKLQVANEDLERISNEAKKLNETLKKLNTTKDKFFSIISHDLKNPVNTLCGFTGFINEKYDSLSDEKKKSYINAINAAGTNLKNLIEALLEWGRLQKKGDQFNPVQVNIMKITEMVIDNLKIAIEKKRISIQTEFNKELTVFADFQMVYSVFRNILTNAVKYSNSGGKVKIYTSSTDSHVMIFFEDNGVGMIGEDVNNLFKLDTSYSTPGTENESGTGLGLILCKEFIEINKGQIGVSSKPGAGSTFWILLPGNNNFN